MSAPNEIRLTRRKYPPDPQRLMAIIEKVAAERPDTDVVGLWMVALAAWNAGVEARGGGF